MDELKTLIMLALQQQSPLTKKHLIRLLKPTKTASINVLECALKELKDSGAIDSKPDPNCSRFRLIWFVPSKSQITSDFVAAIPDPDVRSQFVDLCSYDPESALRYLNFVYTHEQPPADGRRAAKFYKTHISNQSLDEY